MANKELKEYDTPSVYYAVEITEDLKGLCPDAFIVENYNPDEYVKVEMLAPVK